MRRVNMKINVALSVFWYELFYMLMITFIIPFEGSTFGTSDVPEVWFHLTVYFMSRNIWVKS